MCQIEDKLRLLAKENKHGYPFSAAICYKDQWLFAVNTVLADYNPCAHAEINVIKMCCEEFSTIDLSGAVLFASGEPCSMCLSAIAWAGIKTVFYLDSYNVAKKLGFALDCNSRELNRFLKLGININKL